MYELTAIKQTMGSRELANITNKRHDHVLRDCDVLNENYERLALPKLGVSSYKDSTGRSLKCYELTRMQTFDLMTGYNVELRIKVNRRWEELEQKNLLDFTNPDTVLMLAQNWKDEQAKRIAAEEQVQLQANELIKVAPKVRYHDQVLQSKSAHVTNVLAKDIGTSAQSLNKFLHKIGVIYKSGNTWVLYYQYQDRGFTEQKTHHYFDSEGKPASAKQTCWTERGCLFVHSLAKTHKVFKYKNKQLEMNE